MGNTILGHSFGVLALLALPNAALAWDSGEELSQVIFGSVDSSGNGLLDFGEIAHMSQSIAYSADSDEDERVSLEEFMAWDFGYAYLAEREDGAEGFAMTKRIMFAVADLDSDAEIDEREWRLNTRWSFERADADGDALLTEDEFISGWTPIVMLKAGRGG